MEDCMTTWVLVANRVSARILSRQDGRLEDVEELARAALSDPDPELVFVTTDAASVDRGDGEPSGEWAVARQQTAASTFALRVAAHLERARQRGSFERLVLV